MTLVKDFRDFPESSDWSLLVYGLLDPYTGELRYVGKSSSGMTRPNSHFWASRLEADANKHKSRWIKSMQAQGSNPIVIILKECDSEKDLNDSETDLIRFFKVEGFRLVNITDGGGGSLGVKLSAETIAKRTASRAGWSPSVETRAKLSAAAKGKPKPKEGVEKSAAARKGMKRSNEFCTHMSKIMTGKPSANPEHIKKLGASWKGKKRSEETKRKMSEAKKAYWAERKSKAVGH